RNVLHFEIPRSEEGRGPTLYRHRIEMLPAIALPRENDAARRTPKKLVLRHHWVEDAAGPILRTPDLPAGSVGDGCHTNGPGIARARTLSGTAASPAASVIAHEGDLLSIGRPCGIAVAIHA